MITNIEVTNHGGRYALSWEKDDFRFHVWAIGTSRTDFQTTLYKNPPLTDGRERTIKRDRTAASNAADFTHVLHMATVNHLFDKADAALAAVEARRDAEAVEGARLHRMRQRAPAMFAALQRVAMLNPDASGTLKILVSEARAAIEGIDK